MFTKPDMIMSSHSACQSSERRGTLWPMRGLHHADKAGKNNPEKLTVQGKLIGTDTHILSVCVYVFHLFHNDIC